MPRVLITAFEPYGQWQQNASWLTLVEFTQHLPAQPEVVTRLYPVDFAKVRQRLQQDLQENYDVAIHLGQAPGTAAIQLESIGVNVGGYEDQTGEELQPLTPDGPVAYQSALPLTEWSAAIRRLGIPAKVSYHAGTYLCNATLYWSHHFAQADGLTTKSLFVHLPLAMNQTAHMKQPSASLPVPTLAAALQTIVALAGKESPKLAVE